MRCVVLFFSPGKQTEASRPVKKITGTFWILVALDVKLLLLLLLKNKFSFVGLLKPLASSSIPDVSNLKGKNERVKKFVK